MSQEALRGVITCVFDAFGTVFKFASAARTCRDVPGDRGDTLTAPWRDKQVATIASVVLTTCGRPQFTIIARDVASAFSLEIALSLSVLRHDSKNRAGQLASISTAPTTQRTPLVSHYGFRSA